jgi:L-ascorbate metabolism protein UlaG (beta-lactamase superfamily)
MNAVRKGAASAGAVRVTLVGNATILIEGAGIQVITDPWLGERVGPWRRWRAAALSAADLQGVALVLISHAHADHLHLPSLAEVSRATPVLTPGGPPARRLQRAGFTQVRSMERWETWSEGELAVTAVPCVHVRWSLGYVIELGGVRIYFAGDAGPQTPFAAIRERCGPLDVAALPIGGSSLAFGPFQRHLTPLMAARAAEALRGRLVLPMHWGHVPCVPAVLDRFRGAPEAFQAAMARAAPGIPVRLLLEGDGVEIGSGGAIQGP